MQWQRHGLRQHRLAPYVVECAEAVYGSDREGIIHVGCRPQRMSDAVHARPRGKSVLERSARVHDLVAENLN